jgi:lysophospholipid acyltransferase (LPLAT)-like uncharacterized protein
MKSPTKKSKEKEGPPGAAMKSHLYEDSPRQWSLWQRFQISLAAHVGYWLVYLIGRTLRFESRGDQNLEEIYRAGHRAILILWHNRIFGSTWYWRQRGIVVMTSQNFDGEYIARFIEMFGYGAARGSSSRGGLRALLEMAKCLKKGTDVAFTIDGPRGPRYEAKIGPVLLARKTGDAIFCFHTSYQKKWVIRGSWDQFQIPKPFSRALIIKGPPIYVDAAADEAMVQAKHVEMQKLLDRLREEGDSYWTKDPPD